MTDPHWRERLIELLQRSFPGRCAYRFLALEGIDRALALSSRAFVAVIPLGIVATAFTPTRQSFGDRLVERFDLDNEAASAIRQLFTTPSDVRGAASVVGLVALLVTSLSFARSLQRTYERIWRLDPLGPRGIGRGLAWIAGLAAWFAFVVPTRNLIGDLGVPALYLLVTAASSALFWSWTPFVLLGGRIAWRRLLPSAVLTGVALTALTAASVVYLPHTIERAAELYGLIGVTFAFVTWLFSSALVIIAAAVIGAEASSEA